MKIYPVYNAIMLQKDVLIGGSTQPSIMTVANDNGDIIGEYVVKVFKQKNIQEYQPTNKEFYAHFLATEFDLSVPNAAFIKVDKTIINLLKQSHKYQGFDIEEGYYFGTKYIIGASIFNPNILPHFEDEDIFMLFAFDVLVRNMDRRINKPNLLISANEFHLIDHELSLDIHSSFKGYVDRDLWQIITKGKRKHITFDFLLKMKNIELHFDTFFEYIRNINFQKLEQLANQLELYEQNIIDFQAIMNYLYEIKQNPLLFRGLLKQLLNE